MKPTKTLTILPLAFGAALVATTASAQTMSFDGIDQNGDRVLEMAELEAAFGANAQAALTMYDTNGDGMVERNEAASAQASASANVGGAVQGMEDETMQSAETALDDVTGTVQDAGDDLANATSDLLDDTSVSGGATVDGTVMSN
ncbi:MAG: hypothetical protein HOY44_07255 [Maritimibacter sp.]|uniref:hypothetical protein n=1 Tax=Maritimibacter sp. TaxID=2003363 RepID=UPI001DD2540B|nr:hypothetical protein [Maritimibacter sp.]MBL6427311.1 hypothetical protein [Maritimibacter sp.]